MLELATARVLGVRSALNQQARHGADLMSRLDYATRDSGGLVLEGVVRRQVGNMIEELVAEVASRGHWRASDVAEVVLVGNTVMHHLFSGLAVDGLARHPFEPKAEASRAAAFRAGGAGVGEDPAGGGDASGVSAVSGEFRGQRHFGGHFGGAPARERRAAGVGGSSGEIVVGNRERMICTSTAAGPAFEGARILMGMRAATGAIAEVTRHGDGLVCRVIGGGRPRGVCGGGLVDAVAVGLIWPGCSRMDSCGEGRVCRSTKTWLRVQCDIRELQLAKGAIASGVRLLARRWGTTVEDLEGVYLAGAFGNSVNRASARRIGFLPFATDRIRPAGNTALLGAKLALFRSADDPGAAYARLRGRVEHMALNDDPGFLDQYIQDMGFPAAG